MYQSMFREIYTQMTYSLERDPGALFFHGLPRTKFTFTFIRIFEYKGGMIIRLSAFSKKDTIYICWVKY